MKKYGLLFAWFIALCATLATLFAQYFLQWPVCPLCWYQRVAIYPLVILLGIAAYKNDRAIIPYALPFSVIGFLFAAYQYCEQMISGFAPIQFCTASDIPCNAIHLKLLGFITLPFLSAVGCVLIFIFLLLSRNQNNH